MYLSLTLSAEAFPGFLVANLRATFHPKVWKDARKCEVRAEWRTEPPRAQQQLGINKKLAQPS